MYNLVPVHRAPTKPLSQTRVEISFVLLRQLFSRHLCPKLDYTHKSMRQIKPAKSKSTKHQKTLTRQEHITLHHVIYPAHVYCTGILLFNTLTFKAPRSKRQNVRLQIKKKTSFGLSKLYHTEFLRQSTNSAEPDEAAHDESSHLGLRRLQIQLY